MKAYPPEVTRRKLHKLCRELQGAESMSAAVDAIRRFADRRRRRSSWYRYFHKLADSLDTGANGFRIFVQGNSKLPFWNFSTLPQYTCPGAGDCLKYCYSFTAWRYPAAVARQIQNTLLLRFKPAVVESAFNALPNGATVRLYVDGDIDSLSTLEFWFRLLFSRPDVKAYGYSKSFEVFREWRRQNIPGPKNYKLNLSSGSRYENEPITDEVAALPIARDSFVTVPTSGRYHLDGFNRYQNSAYHRDVRASARELYGESKVFSCPGRCGTCLPNGQHACGAESMRGVLIAIGEH